MGRYWGSCLLEWHPQGDAGVVVEASLKAGSVLMCLHDKRVQLHWLQLCLLMHNMRCKLAFMLYGSILLVCTLALNSQWAFCVVGSCCLEFRGVSICPCP